VFSINWHIKPTGHTFLNDVYLAISKARNASLSAFIAIPRGFSKIQKFGVGVPPSLVWGIFSVKFEIFNPKYLCPQGV